MDAHKSHAQDHARLTLEHSVAMFEGSQSSPPNCITSLRSEGTSACLSVYSAVNSCQQTSHQHQPARDSTERCRHLSLPVCVHGGIFLPTGIKSASAYLKRPAKRSSHSWTAKSCHWYFVQSCRESMSLGTGQPCQVHWISISLPTGTFETSAQL